MPRRTRPRSSDGRRSSLPCAVFKTLHRALGIEPSAELTYELLEQAVDHIVGTVEVVRTFRGRTRQRPRHETDGPDSSCAGVPVVAGGSPVERNDTVSKGSAWPAHVKYSVKVPSFEVDGPFSDAPIDDVRLDRAPLARVLMQIRYPRLASLAVAGHVADRVASALAEVGYPILSEQQEMSIAITPDGVVPTPGGGRLLQLRSPDEVWQVTFGAEFIALHTSAYIDRNDFMKRTIAVIDIFSEVVKPPFAERIGFRYVNRIEGPDRLELPRLIRSQVLGGLAVPPGGAQLAHSINESVYSLADRGPDGSVTDGLQARWGLLPPGATLDPSLPPSSEESWVLDLDSVRVAKRPFEASGIEQEIRELSVRAYRYFRWIVTDHFISHFGRRD